MSDFLSRRDALRLSMTGLIAGAAAGSAACALADEPADPRPEPSRPFLTPAKDFKDVSRGTPLPHSLMGEALVAARLTDETWRLEIFAEDKATMGSPKRLEDNTALDLPALLDLGKTKGLAFLKAMQCNNIPLPLGQGLWEGVPLREVLKLCGPIDNARRLYYWGFHNNDPKQVFRSSLAMSQVLDTPPGEMPPFLAYRLNGEPIPLTRGGPVRMIVPWAHGFKSIKWLQRIVLTNKHENNDTYADANNDPESYLKTAAYFDDGGGQTLPAGQPLTMRGTAMVGWPGLARVELWLRQGNRAVLPDSDPAWQTAEWQKAVIEPPPRSWKGQLPEGLDPRQIWGFNADGMPKQWPMRFSIAHWSFPLTAPAAGAYELRVRTVDDNGFAQPEPRPGQKSGRNLVQCKLLTFV